MADTLFLGDGSQALTLGSRLGHPLHPFSPPGL